MKAPNNLKPALIALPDQGLRLLRSREWDVLIFIADALSNEQIAERLCISPKSVENYRTRISHKLQQKGIGKLAEFAGEHRAALRYWYEEIIGMLPPPPIMGDISETVTLFLCTKPLNF